MPRRPILRATVLATVVAATVLVSACASFPIGAWMGHGASGAGPGMMRGAGSTGTVPGTPAFVAGTPTAPRVVRISAGPGYTFNPSQVTVITGETITFAVSAVGPAAHEFKVGPLDVVLADGDAPEIAGIGMMQTKSLTYTFSGSGPFGYACHEPGHLEAGMEGRILVVSG
jgi:uncharacterized cupredoxin-like copper-binding protein